MNRRDQLVRGAGLAVLGALLALLLSPLPASAHTSPGRAGAGPMDRTEIVVVTAPRLIASATVAAPSSFRSDPPRRRASNDRDMLPIAGAIVAFVAATLVLALVFAPRTSERLLSQGRDRTLRERDEGP